MNKSMQNANRHQRDRRATTSASRDGDELDVEVQRRVRRYRPSRASRPVPELRRDHQPSLPSHAHRGYRVAVAADPESPALNHLRRFKLQRRAALVARVERASALQPPDVVRLDDARRRRRRAVADDGVAERQPARAEDEFVRALERRQAAARARPRARPRRPRRGAPRSPRPRPARARRRRRRRARASTRTLVLRERLVLRARVTRRTRLGDARLRDGRDATREDATATDGTRAGRARRERARARARSGASTRAQHPR